MHVVQARFVVVAVVLAARLSLPGRTELIKLGNSSQECST